MKKLLSILSLAMCCAHLNAQTNPAIISWLRNTTGITGRHYVSGSSTPITDTYPANVQTVQYSATDAYISCSGIPAYIIGPYLDGNPNQGADNHNIYKITLTPTPNTGTPTPTTLGTIGIFINGVSLFDYRDGVSYKSSTGLNAGGPLGGMGDGAWNRDAIVAEKSGFDCAKGHPAMTNYHHHQNPSAFNLDRVVISTVCNLYLADGLYVIDSAHHSPLIGFAYDGYPIYGAYGYKNADGTGGIVRMKSSYSLRSITTRTVYYDGTTPSAPGPAVSATFPLSMYREDYQFTAPTTSQPDYLDIHNGRFCITPEYPSGTYAYFCTVDNNHNSAYPYVVGPTFYGNKVVTTLTSVPSGTTTYSPTAVEALSARNFNVTIYPNPANDLIAVQSRSTNTTNLTVELRDMAGRLVQTQTLYQGSTMCYFDVQAIYAGNYIIRISDGKNISTHTITIEK